MFLKPKIILKIFNKLYSQFIWQIKKFINKKVLNAKIIEESANVNTGDNQPPKNNNEINVDIKIIFEYSAKKNKTNNKEPYSVL